MHLLCAGDSLSTKVLGWYRQSWSYQKDLQHKSYSHSEDQEVLGWSRLHGGEMFFFPRILTVHLSMSFSHMYRLPEDSFVHVCGFRHHITSIVPKESISSECIYLIQSNAFLLLGKATGNDVQYLRSHFWELTLATRWQGRSVVYVVYHWNILRNIHVCMTYIVSEVTYLSKILLHHTKIFTAGKIA